MAEEKRHPVHGDLTERSPCQYRRLRITHRIWGTGAHRRSQTGLHSRGSRGAVQPDNRIEVESITAAIAVADRPTSGVLGRVTALDRDRGTTTSSSSCASSCGRHPGRRLGQHDQPASPFGSTHRVRGGPRSSEGARTRSAFRIARKPLSCRDVSHHGLRHCVTVSGYRTHHERRSRVERVPRATEAPPRILRAAGSAQK